MAIFKTGGNLLQGASGFKLEKGDTHQTLLVRNNNVRVTFTPELVRGAWGKTFVMELIGPFTTAAGLRTNSGIQAFNPTAQTGEYTGDGEVGAGTPRDKIWVRNSVEIKVTPPYGFVKTYSATASSRVAIPEGGVTGELRGDIALGYYNDGPLETPQGGTPYSAYDNIMRITLEGETGADETIQGLTRDQRRGIYQNFLFIDKDNVGRKLTATNPIARANNSHYLVRLESEGSFKIRNVHPSAVGKRFIVDLIGPYGSTDNLAFPAAAYTNPLGTSSAAILDSFQLTFTPDSANKVKVRSASGSVITTRQLVTRGKQFDFKYTEADGDGDNYYVMRVKLVAGHGLTAAQTRSIFSSLSVHYDDFDSGDNLGAKVSDRAKRSDTHFAITMPTGNSEKDIHLAINDANAINKDFEIEIYGPYTPVTAGVATDSSRGYTVVANEAEGTQKVSQYPC